METNKYSIPKHKSIIPLPLPIPILIHLRMPVPHTNTYTMAFLLPIKYILIL